MIYQFDNSSMTKISRSLKRFRGNFLKESISLDSAFQVIQANEETVRDGDSGKFWRHVTPISRWMCALHHKDFAYM